MEITLAVIQTFSDFGIIATEQPNNLSGPQVFTIVVAVAATLTGVITAKVFKDKDDQGKN